MIQLEDNISRFNTRVGFYSSLAMTFVMVITFLTAVLTPPMSGPWCETCFEYPYTDIASRFPRDYYWMYPATLLPIVFIALIVCLHQYAEIHNRFYSLAALGFGVISSGILFIDYFTQLTVIQPSLLRGETDGISLLTQYNPHGIFIALEEAGYLLMSLSLFFTVPLFSKTRKVERVLRVVHSIPFPLSVVSFIIVSVIYGIDREYRFEVIVITINYMTLITSGTLLAKLFGTSER